MGRLYQPLLFLLARCTRNELNRQVEWIKAKNEMLRKHIDRKRIFLNQEEKARLMKLGQAIGPGLRHFITIVTYKTYLSWVRKVKEKGGHRPKKMGRPRTAESIRRLIVKIGTETGWSCTRDGADQEARIGWILHSKPSVFWGRRWSNVRRQAIEEEIVCEVNRH